MCERGTWRGFHTRYLETPDGVESPLVVVEQCTECGSYRARDLEDFPYVQAEEKVKQSDQLPDPQADDGSVWGPNNGTTSGDTDSW